MFHVDGQNRVIEKIAEFTEGYPPTKFKNINRDDLVQFLNDNNIPCGVYYPVPLHKQKAYEDKRYNEDDFKVTNQLIKEVISLPMHTELDDEQINYITSKIITFING